MTGPAPLKSPQDHGLPLLAIVGRPNVGKSTLFNRLVGERRAIVDDRPGVTRDRNYAEAEWAGSRYRLVDTGGLDSNRDGGLEERVQEQSRRAVEEAHVVLFLFDGKSGLNPLDREWVDTLRKAEKPVLYAVNKLDSRRRTDNLYEFYALGLDPIYAISAEHGLGIPDLMEDVIRRFSASSDDHAEVASGKSELLRVAVIGRPNVGKSTLINRLLGFERAVVDAVPGTTRDVLDSHFALAGVPCILMDTAGIRRKARITDRVERFSVAHSLCSVDRGDLMIHVIDGPEGVTDQDAQILSYAVARGKALVLAVNKWDLLLNDHDPKAYRDEVCHRLSFLDYAPILFIAAATGYGIRKMTEAAAQTMRVYQREVATSRVNRALQRVVRAHTPPLWQGKAVKFYYGTQTATQPPTVTLFVNRPRGVLESYRRYLTHHLRTELGFEGSPLRLVLRPRREDKKDS